MLNAVIIDDEAMARTLLAEMVKEYCPQVNIVEECKDLPSGVKAINKHQPDIVFLDIEMPGHSGLELLEFFNEDQINFSIIFITAYDKYAIKAFKLSAVDYLLKPFETEELTTAIAKVEKMKDKASFALLKNNLNPNSSKKLSISTVSSNRFIELDHILYIKAEGAYSFIYLKSGESITTSKGLKYYEELLSEIPQFFRCQKSYIVNTPYITEYIKSDGGELIVNNEHRISISPDKVAELNKLINILK